MKNLACMDEKVARLLTTSRLKNTKICDAINVGSIVIIHCCVKHTVLIENGTTVKC